MVAILLHLYYQDLWLEFKSKIIPLLNKNVHLYITVNEESEYTDDMRSFAKKVFIVKNKGMDFGPFIYSWNEIKDIGYDYVLKLHSKKSESSIHKMGKDFGTDWRNDMVNALIKNKYQFDMIIDTLKKSPEIYMVGSKKWFISENKETVDNQYRLRCISSIKKLLSFVNSQEHGSFFGGSIFLVTSDYLKKLFGDCNLVSLYEEFEDYYSSYGETLAHGFERVIGYGVTKNNGKFHQL